jgi:hypothetical protein
VAVTVAHIKADNLMLHTEFREPVAVEAQVACTAVTLSMAAKEVAAVS